jgi:hypothetical protein
MVFFYFVQLSLLMTPPASYVLQWLSFLNFTPAASGLCIIPLSPSQQIMLTVMTPVWLGAQLLLLMIGQWVTGRFDCGRRIITRRGWQWRSYMRTSVDLYMFSYSSVATILVSVLRCTTVDGQSFIFDYPSVLIPCFSYLASSYSLLSQGLEIDIM